MKKLTFLLVLMSHIFYAQQKVTITGTVKNFKGKSVVAETLKNSLRYEYIILDTTKLDKNGKFTLKFNTEKPSKIKLKIGEEYTELYAVNGDNISISVDAKNFDKSIKYNGSNKEWNQFVASEILNENWNFRYSICKNKESLFLDSLQIFYLSKIKNAETLILNDVLKAFVLEYIDYTQANIKLMYTYYHKNMNKLEEKPQLSTNYYDFISKLNLNNQKTLNLSLYQQLLGYLSNHYTEELYNKDTTQSYDSLNQIVIQNRFKNFDKEILVSNEIIETLMYGFDVLKADSLLMKNDELLKNSTFKNEITEVRDKVKKYAKGAVAQSFSFPDMNGKMVSLSDFKGKIVYLDVWASWCGPCRREIPAAKELEKQMHGKDVVFLCVSVDGDEAAWKKIVKEKELTGIHIHSKGDFKSEMTKLYDINSIPTYIIIDRNGKIWKMGAERPSGKAKEELEEALK